MQSSTFAYTISFSVFQNTSHFETNLVEAAIFSEPHQLNRNESSYLRWLFCKKTFFRVSSCLEQLLLIILICNKYFFWSATTWRSLLYISTVYIAEYIEVIHCIFLIRFHSFFYSTARFWLLSFAIALIAFNFCHSKVIWFPYPRFHPKVMADILKHLQKTSAAI